MENIETVITNLLTSSILILTMSTILLAIYGYCYRSIMYINLTIARRILSKKIFSFSLGFTIVGFFFTFIYSCFVLYFSAVNSVCDKYYWAAMGIDIILLIGAPVAIIIVLEGFRQISKKIIIGEWKSRAGLK